MLAEAAREIGEHHTVSVHVATGTNLKKTVTEMAWEPGSVLFVGSSRLAGERRLFLGTTAARVLRHLPIPMLVLPGTADEPAPAPDAREQDRPDNGPAAPARPRGAGGTGSDDQEVTP